MLEDTLEIGGKRIACRLFVGTGKYSSHAVMREVLLAAGADVVTVALRRVDSSAKMENILDYVPQSCTVMINTSGARNAEEAIRIARLARAAVCGKLDQGRGHCRQQILLPDNMETLKATEILVREGFVVFPYMSPDLSMARRMADCGASAVMPSVRPSEPTEGSGRKNWWTS
jgi:thiazole synthase